MLNNDDSKLVARVAKRLEYSFMLECEQFECPPWEGLDSDNKILDS